MNILKHKPTDIGLNGTLEMLAYADTFHTMLYVVEGLLETAQTTSDLLPIAGRMSPPYWETFTDLGIKNVIRRVRRQSRTSSHHE